MSEHIAIWLKDNLQGQAWDYMSRIGWQDLAAALIILAIAASYLKTLTRKFGILPLVGLALFGGAWYAGTRSIGPVVKIVERPVEVEKIVEKPVSSDYRVGELWDKYRAEEKARKKLESEMEKARAEISESKARIEALMKARGSGQKGTRVKLNDGTPDEPNSNYGTCGYCQETLIISGDKGSDVIRCPSCGAKMPALKAIMYRMQR